MIFQESVAVRNARLDAEEVAVGVSPIMHIRTGAPPVDCAAARTGTILATINLPADWMAAAAAGSKGLAGVWSDAAADAAGVAGHFSIMNSANTVCHYQGDVGMPASGAALILNNTNIAVGQTVTISTFTITAGNA